MLIYFLERIRKLLKSIGKKEELLNNFINYKKFKYIEKDFDLNLDEFKSSIDIKEPIKIIANITFYFNENKVNNLSKVCESLNQISNNIEIYIFVNKVTDLQIQKLEEKLSKDVKINMISEVLHNRLLPWYHLNFVKKLYEKRQDITHFIYLEDDILINKINFNYWVNARKILKKFNLIPGFIRTEINNLDNEIYAIDFVKKDKFNLLPKVKILKDYYFINHSYPYQGMYLYDRDLMKEHLYGPSSNPDCGHGAFDTNYIDKRMINLDLMAKANIGLTYLNKPKGFFSRIVIPYHSKEKIVNSDCQIKHLSNKYANTKSWFGNIKLKDIVI